MIESVKTFLLIIILIYAIVITVLYWTEYTNKQQYLQDKSNNLNDKEKELIRRENSIVDKEVCFRELTKLQTIQTSALTLLKSYNDSYLKNLSSVDMLQPKPNITENKNNVVQELPKAEAESSWITMLSGIINQ
jgi:predicted PurR-regulated permease PerM